MPENGNENRYFNFQKYLLLFSGGVNIFGEQCHIVWPYAILVWTVMAITTFFELAECFFVPDWSEKVNYLMNFGGVGLDLVKLMFFAYYKNDIRRVFNGLEAFVQSSKNVYEKGEKQIIKDNLRLIYLQVASNLVPTFLMTIVYPTLSSLYRIYTAKNGERNLPFYAVTLLDWRKSPTFEIMWVIQVASWSGAIGAYTSFTAVLVSMLGHVKMHCMILIHKFEFMMESSYERMIKAGGSELSEEEMEKLRKHEIDTQDTPFKYMQEEVRDLVNYQLEIYNSANDIQNTLNFFMLLDFAIDISIMSVGVLHARKFKITDIEVFRDGDIALCVFIKLLLTCYTGHDITLLSENAARGCMKSSFIGTDIRFQKELVFIMERSQRGIIIKAGKLATLNLSTLIWILRFTYSVFMILTGGSKRLK